MALTFSRDTPRGGMPVGNMKLVIGQLTFDGAYPAGGEPYKASLFGLQKVIRLMPFPAKGYIPEHDKANKKIKMYQVPSLKAFTVKATETATDSTTFVSIVEGDGTAQPGVKVSHAGGAPADIDVNTESKALSEVPDGANLSDVTITVMVWGY